MESVLQVLGFHTHEQERNMFVLVNYALGLVVVAYFVLHAAVKEKR
jgi:hypothetical protein